jgi:hypothetical protein
MNYYTYTIYFVDGFYYHGYHKHEGVDPITDGYFGSPVTHREKWLTTMYWKEITGLYGTVDEVTFAEQEAIKSVFSVDPYCLNANCNGIIPPELARKGAIKAGKKAGEDAKKNKTRVCNPVHQQRGRQKSKELGTGFYDPEFQQSEMMREVRRQNGIKTSSQPEALDRLAKARENVDPVKRRILARERALRLEAEGRGLGSIPYEERAERSRVVGKKVCSSKWADPDHPEIGIHNPGNLAKVQRKLGLPSGKEHRIRVG